MLPSFEVVARQRPVELTRPATGPLDRAVAPFLTVEGPPGEALEIAGSGVRLRGRYDGVARLEVTAGGRTSRHRSWRHGRAAAPVDRVALTLTGRWLTVLVREAGVWVARGRVDLADRVDTSDEAWLATVSGDGLGSDGLGAFGQLGLRDLRVVTRADGTPYRPSGPDGPVHLTATSAGPGFFDTAHTSVWTFDPGTFALTHTADLFFRRPDRPGVLGDHATHLVRDHPAGRWLVATSTWGDFDRSRPVRITVATSADDLLHGTHVLDTVDLRLPTDGLRSVAVWDPHLVRPGSGEEDAEWLVGFVNARRYFEFHPAVAGGPALDDLRLLGADTSRTATEGTTLLHLDGAWRLVASDRQARAYPVHDLTGRRTGRLDAPYPSNLPWPTLLPPAVDGGDWLLVTFDGTPAAGRLPGYGTHGDVVVMRGLAPV